MLLLFTLVWFCLGSVFQVAGFSDAWIESIALVKERAKVTTRQAYHR